MVTTNREQKKKKKKVHFITLVLKKVLSVISVEKTRFLVSMSKNTKQHSTLLSAYHLSASTQYSTNDSNKFNNSFLLPFISLFSWHMNTTTASVSFWLTYQCHGNNLRWVHAVSAVFRAWNTLGVTSAVVCCRARFKQTKIMACFGDPERSPVTWEEVDPQPGEEPVVVAHEVRVPRGCLLPLWGRYLEHTGWTGNTLVSTWRRFLGRRTSRPLLLQNPDLDKQMLMDGYHHVCLKASVSVCSSSVFS